MTKRILEHNFVFGFLYSIAFFLFCLVYLPTFFIKKKSGDHLWERFGSVLSQEKKGKIFWLHAVSLGEALAAAPLVEEIRNRYPEIRFAFSTTTRTGRAAFGKLRTPQDILFYFPLDFTWVIRRLLKRLKPDIFATMETEIWPNLLLTLKRHNVPALLLNGRISEKSFRNYRLIRWALQRPLVAIDLFCMQYQEDARRIQALGADPRKIHVVGNLKFDVRIPKEEGVSDGVREKLGLKPEEILWIAGSTHPGEEKWILEIYADLLRTHRNLRLLIAPRHPERAREVVKLIDTFHWKALLFSENGERKKEGFSVFVLDTIGQLLKFYAAADFVFVGGSLVPRGGQNPLEPAFFEKPILFGPHMENFRDIVRLFLEGHAAIQVTDEVSLAVAARSLLENKTLRRALGEKAKQIVLSHQGVVNRHLEEMKAFLER